MLNPSLERQERLQKRLSMPDCITRSAKVSKASSYGPSGSSQLV